MTRGSAPLRRRGRLTAALVAGVCAAATVVTAGPAAAAPSGPRGSIALPTALPNASVVPNELIVRFRAGVGPREGRALHAAAGATRTARAATLGIDVARVAPGRSVAAAMRRYEADPRVASVEQDARRFPSIVPSDALFRQQWGLRNLGQRHRASYGGSHQGRGDADVDATEAWNVTTGDPSVVIAVLDTGVQLNHPDLAGAIWTNEAEANGEPDVDDDGNGYIDDVNGWDFISNDANPNPSPNPNDRDRSHGTHVAGVIGAQHDAYGIAGLCPDCRIMPLRFGLTIAQEILAIDYAVANGASVINMSFGGPVWSAAERAAIRRAGEAGVLVVAAAGNASLDNDLSAFIDDYDTAPSFPASYDLPTIITVAASNDRDVYGYASYCDQRGIPLWVCAFTSWGRTSVDVAAPGVDTMSTVIWGTGFRGGDHDVWDGTSMAAPHVSGIAGLVRSAHPGLGPVQVKNAIMNGVDRPSSLRLASYHQRTLRIPAGPIAGRFTRTQGRVNAALALEADTSNATRRNDGTIAGAKALKRTARGRVSWPADVNDVFAKRLPGQTRYRVVLKSPSRGDLDLFVWNRDTVDLWQFDAGCFAAKGRCPALRGAGVSPRSNEAVTFRTGKAGTYYVHVAGWYSGGKYRLTIRRA